MLHNAALHLMKCDVINDVKLFPTAYRITFDVVQSELALQNQVH